MRAHRRDSFSLFRERSLTGSRSPVNHDSTELRCNTPIGDQPRKNRHAPLTAGGLDHKPNYSAAIALGINPAGIAIALLHLQHNTQIQTRIYKTSTWLRSMHSQILSRVSSNIDDWITHNILSGLSISNANCRQKGTYGARCSTLLLKSHTNAFPIDGVMRSQCTLC